MDDNLHFLDIKGIFRRRKLGFIFFFTIVFLISIITAFVLPPVYISKTTVLIEDQQIPRAYIQTTVTSFVSERLQIISQQVMSRTKLLEIIDKFNLYPQMRKNSPIEDVLDEMRKDIKLETISADVVDKRTGRAGTATIAFSLSYEGLIPSTVQRVANVLASLYLEENAKIASKQASSTTEFFKEEKEKISKEIDFLEKKISDFKKKHIGELPEYNIINQQALERFQRDIDQISLQVRTLKERKVYLEAQLSAMGSHYTVQTGYGPEAKQLQKLKTKLSTLQANKSDKHPDVIELKKQINQMEAGGTRAGSSYSSKVKKLQKAESELSALQAKYGPKHPDVKKKQREVDAARKDAGRVSRRSSGGRKVVNPAFINLKTQLDATVLEINALEREKIAIKEKIETYQKRIEKAPIIEREYTGLLRSYETARAKYSRTTAKLIEAEEALSMEEEQKGERFTIIEPAVLPTKPHKPNRPIIAIIGFVLALGAGASYAGAREALDSSIKSESELAHMTGLPLLSVVPMMENEGAKRRNTLKWIVLGGIIVIALATALVLTHFFVMPLDILWIKIQKKIMFF